MRYAKAGQIGAVVALGLSLGGISALSGCNRSGGQASDGGSAGAPSTAEAAATGGQRRPAPYASSGESNRDSYGEQANRPPVPLFHGEPMWSENRRHSAKENAEYHFERAGPDLGAKTLDDFLTKVHRFGDHPPAGTLKLVRANGDRLLYDPKANLFAVFTSEGAPRTVFKPESGMDYWREQKTREAEGGGYGRRSYGGYGGGQAGGNGGDAAPGGDAGG